VRIFDMLAHFVVVVLAFACGMFAVWVAPGYVAEANALLGKNRLFIAVVFGFCILASGATAYIMAYLLRDNPRWLLVPVKLSYIALPGVAAAGLLSALLSSLGLIRIAHSPAFLCLCSASYISAALAGLAAMHSIAEYREIFPRW
jgi:hypothetical protein